MKALPTLSLIALLLAAGSAGALTWTVETVDSSGRAGQYASLAVDGAGNLHLCYYDSLEGDLRYARKSGGGWSLSAIDTSGDVGRFCAIAVGADNNPRVGYFDSTNRALKYAAFSGSAWVTETPDPGPGVGQYTSLCLLGTTDIISYHDQERRNLKLATKTTSWALTQIDTAGDVGRFTSVANSGNNQTRISYYSDTQRQLVFARQQGINWVRENPDPAIDAGIHTSLVLSGDVPTIAYLDSAGGRVKRAVKPAGWVLDTADNSGTGGGYVSLALDPTGQPVVSFFDRVNGDLRVSRRVGGTWVTEAVDTVGTVGMYTSCRVSADSIIYVAYYDQTRGWLKLASSFLDNSPPAVASMALSPDTVRQEGFTVLTGRITDNRGVAGAEYFLDSAGAPGSGISPSPVAGFGPASVDVFDTIFTAPLSPGLHVVYLRGLDSAGLWGALDSAWFYKAGPDTSPPSFSIQVSPSSPAVGSLLSISAVPSEALHPDSAVSCTLRSGDGSFRTAPLLRDSAVYTAELSTAGLASGPCRLTVSGYDRWANRGWSFLDLSLAAGGEFLPDGMVYAWPNPARGDRVHFHYYVNSNAMVTAEVFALDGRRVTRLTGRGDGGRPPHQASSNAVVWDIRGVASDVYILRLTAVSDADGENRTVVKKFAIVK